MSEYRCGAWLRSLVVDYEAMLPFLPALLPEVEKLVDHSHPEVSAPVCAFRFRPTANR